jgi:hypothetical protein
VADNVEEEGSQGRDETLVHELEWLREFTPVTRRAAASLPSMGGERMVVVCHLDIKMIPFLGALVAVGAGVWACSATRPRPATKWRST